MTALIITAIVSVTAIIACNCILYRRLCKQLNLQTNEKMYKLNQTYGIVLTLQRRIEEIKEVLDEAADLKECIDVLRKDNDYNNNEPTN